MSVSSAAEPWIERADEDYHTALAMLRQRKYPAPDVVCFHCQQCAEKYLKAYLAGHETEFPKTHDLRELRRLSARIDASFDLITEQLLLLKNYAVPFRYPGFSATDTEAREAVAAMKAVRKLVRGRLGIR